MNKGEISMKRIQKLLALSCALALTAPLAGCQGPQKTPAGTSGADPASITFPYTGDPVALKGLWCNHNNRKNDTLVYNEYLRRIGNITIDWEEATWADYSEKLDLYYSSNDVPDFAVCGGPVDTTSQYGPSGIFLDYEQYKDYMPNFQALTKKHDYLNLPIDEEGHRYVLSTSIDGILTEDWAMLGWYYNKPLLEKYGIAVPQTLDEFIEAGKKLKAADDSSIPIVLSSELGDLFASIIDLYGNDYDGIGYDIEAQKWFYTPLDCTDVYRKTIENCRTLWEERLLNPEIATDSEERLVQKMSKGNWGFFYGYHDFFQSNFWSNGVGEDWDIQPMLPPSVDGKRYLPYTQTFDGDPWWGIVTGANTKHPELVCSLIDYTISDEISTLLNWGIEGDTYQVNADGQKEFLPDVKVPSHPNGTRTLTDLGIGQYNSILFRMADMASAQAQIYGQWEMDAQKFVDDYLKDGRVIPIYRAQTPHFSPEEQDLISSIMTPVETYTSEEVLKFIMGERSMDEFDKYIDAIRKMGDVQQVVDLYNSKPAFHLAPRG